MPHKPGNDVVRNILTNEYSGKLYLVNPKGGDILVPICSNRIMVAHDLCHSQIEYLRNSIN